MSLVAPYRRERIARLVDREAERIRQFGVTPVDQAGLPNVEADRLLNAGVWGIKGRLSQDPAHVVLGFKPGRLHLGYSGVLRATTLLAGTGTGLDVIMTAREAIREGGAQTDVARKIAASRRALRQLLPLSSIRTDIGEPRWGTWEDQVAPHLKPGKLRQLLGWNEDMPLSAWLTPLAMTVAFLSPQFRAGRAFPTIAPIGMNELAFAELARQTARKINLHPPTFVLVEPRAGLNGQGRMSSANTRHTLYFDERVAAARTKLASAHTGGRPGYDHLRLGGDAASCTFLHTAEALYEPSVLDRLANSCAIGRSCRECKADTIATLDAHASIGTLAAQALMVTHPTKLEPIPGREVDAEHGSPI